MSLTRDLTSTLCTADRQLDDGASSMGDALVGTRALVLIPGTVNYFYDVEGRRLAAALANLGCEAEVRTLSSYVEQTYDWCFLLNIYEIDFAYRDRIGFLKQIQKLKHHCGLVLPVLLESVHTKWFNDSYELSTDAELPTILDVGFANQQDQLSGCARHAYDFLFNGLTEAEKGAARSWLKASGQRPIPWTFVGQVTYERLRLAERFVQDYDPAGFVYLVRHVPYVENGPHLNEREFDRVLRRTRYKIWCSHHPYYYLESIRFRLALLSGCVPIKVHTSSYRSDRCAPFASLIVDEADCVERVRSLDFETARAEFFREFCSLPSLEAGILDFLSGRGEIS